MSLTKVTYSMISGAVANVLDFGADPTGTTDSTAAFIAAQASLPAGEYGAGTIFVPVGTFLINYFRPNPNTILQGAGRLTTTLKANQAVTGANPGLINIDNNSRGRISDLTLDANGLKNFCLGFCAVPSGLNATLWQISNVIMYGGINTQVILGNSVSNPDVASIQFVNSSVYGGSFGSVTPTQGQIEIAGSNTLLISWIGGFIGGAAIPTNIIMSNGEFSCHNVQGGNSTLWLIGKSGGQFRSYDEHTEGSGGYLHTLSNDPQGIISAQDQIISAQITVTGANTSQVAVLLEAGRPCSIISSFFNADIKVERISATTGSGAPAQARLSVFNNQFGAYDGTPSIFAKYQNTAPTNGVILGIDNYGGDIISCNQAVRFGTVNNPAITIGAGNTLPFAVDVNGYGEYTLSSSANVNVKLRNTVLYVIRDLTNGGSAIVYYENNVTPIIIAQSAAVFVTSAPGANEIQVINNGSTLGMSLRAGSSRNNALVSVSYLAAH
jgi:hypothetical protein